MAKDEARAAHWSGGLALDVAPLVGNRIGEAFGDGREVELTTQRLRSIFAEVADKGFVQAPHNLAVTVGSGGGVTQGNAEVLKRYQKAAVRGNVDAGEALRRIDAAGRGRTPEIR